MDDEGGGHRQVHRGGPRVGEALAALGVGPGEEQQADLHLCAHNGVVEIEVGVVVAFLAWCWEG